MKKLFLLLLCVVVITEPSGQRDRVNSLTGQRERACSLGEEVDATVSGHLQAAFLAGGQDEGADGTFAFQGQDGTAVFGGGFLSSGEEDDADWMNGVDPETLFAIAGESGGSASAKKLVGVSDQAL